MTPPHDSGYGRDGRDGDNRRGNSRSGSSRGGARRADSAREPRRAGARRAGAGREPFSAAKYASDNSSRSRSASTRGNRSGTHAGTSSRASQSQQGINKKPSLAASRTTNRPRTRRGAQQVTAAGTLGYSVYERPGMMVKRLRIIVALLAAIMLVLVGRLFWVQVVWGPDLAAKAEQQRSRLFTEPARRGEILDRDGQRLAYTMQARSLTVTPTRLRMELAEQEQNAAAQEGELNNKDDDQIKSIVDERVDKRLEDMASGIPRMIKDSGAEAAQVDEKEILAKLKADTQYEVLVRNVDPEVATDIANEFHGVKADNQDIRQYPNGAIAENVLGKVSMDGQGQFGLEAFNDAILTGIHGSMTEEYSTQGQAIPGTLRDVAPVVDGANIQLTLDLDLQTYLQQKLEKARANSNANSAEAVVLDVATGEVLAMANTGTIDPNQDIDRQLREGKDFENRSISYPYEPGSVAKIITAAAAIEEGITTPEAVHQVPGSIDMAGVTVRDAWEHGVEPYTTAGIFGKSSNVGTLILAEQIGSDKFADYLNAFGLGQTSGIELPNESQGLLPPREQWSGGTFANLPIGQGMAMTTLQLASIYQTIANEGERIQPRIIKQITNPDGTTRELSEPETTQVISPEAARTVTDMFRAAFQADPAGINNGTAQGNHIDGYQLSGKTGTAQKVDPNTGAYSNSAYWITFAGIAPANDPRFVIAIMVDEPKSGVNDDGSGGQSAAPIFRDVTQWLLNRDNIAPSEEAPAWTLRAE